MAPGSDGDVHSADSAQLSHRSSPGAEAGGAAAHAQAASMSLTQKIPGQSLQPSLMPATMRSWRSVQRRTTSRMTRTSQVLVLLRLMCMLPTWQDLHG